MKKVIVFILTLSVAGLLFQSCNSKTEFKTGMSVAAKWTDNNYYLATITKINGDKYSVDYADGTKGDVSSADMKVLTEKGKLKTGDKVLAVWSGAKFYPGKLVELKETNAVVLWDDGSAQSEVEYSKILKME